MQWPWPALMPECIFCTTEDATEYKNHYEIMPFARVLSHCYHQEVWEAPCRPSLGLARKDRQE